ncbi:MAG TPA: hypothetical protein VIT65_07165 [Microlunatus sp.]
MIITHAISSPVGSAMLLLAAIGLLVGVVVLAVSARNRSPRHLTSPDAVPLWWDQAPASGTTVGPTGSPTHG